VDSFTTNSVDVYWEPEVSQFLCYKVYVSTSPIVDQYAKGIVNPSARLVATILDVHNTKCRIDGLLPNTQYYIAVSVQDKTTLTGYKEINMTTAIS
jgi:hypothetical protein